MLVAIAEIGGDLVSLFEIGQTIKWLPLSTDVLISLSHDLSVKKHGLN